MYWRAIKRNNLGKSQQKFVKKPVPGSKKQINRGRGENANPGRIRGRDPGRPLVMLAKYCDIKTNGCAVPANIVFIPEYTRKYWYLMELIWKFRKL